MLKETNIKLVGYEMFEKEVHKSGNSGRVYVPIEWIGKKVKIILIERWFIYKTLKKSIGIKPKMN